VWWRAKVAALTLWVVSPGSRQLLTSEYVTVMVVTTGGPTRREYLRDWTTVELQARGLYDEYASIFAITDISSVTTQPVEFFGGAYWHLPFTGAPESLIDVPVPAAGSPKD